MSRRLGAACRLPVVHLGRHADAVVLEIIVDQPCRATQSALGTSQAGLLGQRIVLYAKDRGCTNPGCDAPAYHSQVHHVERWAATQCTDITTLTLACAPNNRLVEEKGWTTRKNAKSETEWLPPVHLDRGQPRTNRYHHPERFLRDRDDEEPG